jgi:hypothetical protein
VGVGRQHPQAVLHRRGRDPAEDEPVPLRPGAAQRPLELRVQPERELFRDSATPRGLDGESALASQTRRGSRRPGLSATCADESRRIWMERRASPGNLVGRAAAFVVRRLVP